MNITAAAIKPNMIVNATNTDTIFYFFVLSVGLEPTRLTAPDPKSGMSTNSTTKAFRFC